MARPPTFQLKTLASGWLWQECRQCAGWYTRLWVSTLKILSSASPHCSCRDLRGLCHWHTLGTSTRSGRALLGCAIRYSRSIRPHGHATFCDSGWRRGRARGWGQPAGVVDDAVSSLHHFPGSIQHLCSRTGLGHYHNRRLLSEEQTQGPALLLIDQEQQSKCCTMTYSRVEYIFRAQHRVLPQFLFPPLID